MQDCKYSGERQCKNVFAQRFKTEERGAGHNGKKQPHRGVEIITIEKHPSDIITEDRKIRRDGQGRRKNDFLPILSHYQNQERDGNHLKDGSRNIERRIILETGRKSGYAKRNDIGQHDDHKQQQPPRIQPE